MDGLDVVVGRLANDGQVGGHDVAEEVFCFLRGGHGDDSGGGRRLIEVLTMYVREHHCHVISYVVNL